MSEPHYVNLANAAQKRAEEVGVICDCHGYPFPHRMGSGECQRLNAGEPYCQGCGSNSITVEDQSVDELPCDVTACSDCGCTDITDPPPAFGSNRTARPYTAHDAQRDRRDARRWAAAEARGEV